jgi:hypothetical protein
MFREWVGIFELPVICVLFLSLGCRLSGPEPECNSGVSKDDNLCFSSTASNSVSMTAMEEDCKAEGFTLPGPCPSSGLLGCCVANNNAECYYSGYDGDGGVSAAQKRCAFTWQMTAP